MIQWCSQRNSIACILNNWRKERKHKRIRKGEGNTLCIYDEKCPFLMKSEEQNGRGICDSV